MNYKWSYEACYKEAQKYKTRSEFIKNNERAYRVSLKNNWINNYTWLRTGRFIKWTYETCYEEAKKYKTRVEFERNSGGAYRVSLRNNWLDNYTWMIDGRVKLFTDKIDSVYIYLFEQNNAVYVGRSINPMERDFDHHRKGTVYKYSVKYSIEIPPMQIIEQNLTLAEGLERRLLEKMVYR